MNFCTRKNVFFRIILLLLSYILTATGCASFPNNPPLKQMNAPSAYRFNSLLEQNELGDNFVIVTLSGGGTRAGALGYGVLKELEKVGLPEGKTLLDEVKVMSSVSGGSFVSSYYGLYGKEKFFRDFKNDVLYEKINSQLITNLIRVIHWVPIAISADIGRSELAEKMYDKKFFKDHTFKDLPRKWPFIIINSTDMAQGSSFSFVQEDFDRLCSDVSQVKISRAVTASSAFPGAFTPLTFRNYQKSTCGYQTPAWVDHVLSQSPEANPDKFNWALNLKSYDDAHQRPYIHLIDGGIADNLGMVAPLFYFRTGAWNLIDEQQRFKAKRIILIAVDATPANDLKVDKKAAVPKFMNVILSASTKPMRNYAGETIEEFAMRFDVNRITGFNFEKFKELCDQVHRAEEARQQCYDEFKLPFGGIVKPPLPDLYFIHVQFNAIENLELRQELATIGTSLQLKKDQVDLLERAGGKILQESPNFQRLLKDLGVSISNKK